MYSVAQAAVGEAEGAEGEAEATLSCALHCPLLGCAEQRGGGVRLKQPGLCGIWNGHVGTPRMASLACLMKLEKPHQASTQARSLTFTFTLPRSLTSERPRDEAPVACRLANKKARRPN